MPPPLRSPFRQITDWLFDPWASEEERSAWEAARQAKWLRSLSKRDKLRIVEASKRLTSLQPGDCFDDLDAPIRVAVELKSHAKYTSGAVFKEFNGCVLKAFRK